LPRPESYRTTALPCPSYGITATAATLTEGLMSAGETLASARQRRSSLDNANEGGLMGRIVISDNVSLDAVVQDPSRGEGFERGGWVGRIGDQGRDEAAKVLLDEALGTEALLLGRRTYEFLAARWPSRSGALADKLNSQRKYVVSSTLEDPIWNNSTVLT